jgi:hypothetical protein
MRSNIIAPGTINLRLGSYMLCGGPVLGSATLREASWSRSYFSAASSGFDQPSMIALASNRLLELGEPLRKVCLQ